MSVIHHEQFVRETYPKQLPRELFLIGTMTSDAINPGKQTETIYMTSLVSNCFSPSTWFDSSFVLFFSHKKCCLISVVFLPPTKSLQNTKKRKIANKQRNKGQTHRPASNPIVVQTLLACSTSPYHPSGSKFLLFPLFGFEIFAC